MKNLIVSLILAIGLSGGAAMAQAPDDVVWVQIEAHSSLSDAQVRAQYYDSQLADVNGFSLGGSWYGIVLGPYLRSDAEQVIRAYRSAGQIPQDSYVSFTSTLGRQFWPPGVDVLERGLVTATPLTGETTQPAVATEQVVTITPSDETPGQARQSERLLSADERKDLQIALRAAGFYDAAIDGAFGPGTRRSMENWQAASGFEPTGILTTMQRQELMDEYNAPLISVGMQRIGDLQAGIEMQIPAKVVEFSRYEPPFAHFDASSDLGARVLLISQPGEQATLYGLYDIMQTLTIVPLNGPRERNKNSFTLEGRGNGIVSYTQASLEDGHIKGFTLVWPEGDENRRLRVLTEMKASFSRTDGVLDPAAGGDSQQSVDLVAGLEVRQPRLSRSGFYIDGKGTVITTAEAVNGCARITLDQDYEALLVTSDDGLGVAVLRPVEPLAPMSVARFRPGESRLQSDVVVSGYSYGGILGAPTLTFGTLSDIKGLRGETELTRLALAPLPGDAGGPVFDTGGGVLGMLLPQLQSGQQLPKDISFAADAEAIRNVLDVAGLSAENSDESADIAPEELTRIATGMTVLVSCWD